MWDALNPLLSKGQLQDIERRYQAHTEKRALIFPPVQRFSSPSPKSITAATSLNPEEQHAKPRWRASLLLSKKSKD